VSETVNDARDVGSVDKSGWGEGPWMSEPDRVEFRHAGLPCLLRRSPRGGAWCGYVAVPPGHPLHGTTHDGIDVEVHGGLTYSGRCEGDVCHVPAPGEPDDVWWIGFDCGHAFDVSPAREARLRAIDPHLADPWPPWPEPVPAALREVYRDLAYVRGETESLAEQLAALGRPHAVTQER
jgi:hypothetical protein